MKLEKSLPPDEAQKLRFIKKKLADNSNLSESENAFLTKIMDRAAYEEAHPPLIILPPSVTR